MKCLVLTKKRKDKMFSARKIQKGHFLLKGGGFCKVNCLINSLTIFVVEILPDPCTLIAKTNSLNIFLVVGQFFALFWAKIATCDNTFLYSLSVKGLKKKSQKNSSRKASNIFLKKSMSCQKTDSQTVWL